MSRKNSLSSVFETVLPETVFGPFPSFNQKTREGYGCFWGLCGSSGGKFRENSGEIGGKFVPNRQMLQILGFRAPGKANLPGTLGPHCRDLVPTLRAGCFLKSTVPAFSSFSDLSSERAISSFRRRFGSIFFGSFLAFFVPLSYSI